MISCYIHVPFCASICYYCDFCRSVANRQTRLLWLNQVQEEISKIEHSVKTLYLGGGTPSLLEPNEFIELVKPFSVADEFTVEINPETLTQEKINCYLSMGVDRISLGVQTFDDKLLASIGRKHTFSQVQWCIDSLRHAGITNISIDLIYGLPNQTIEDVKNDLSVFLSLDLPHLSIYSLQIEENSVFGKQGVLSCDEEIEADMYEMIVGTLKAAGYSHYEISSFCKPGFHSKHNLSYWQDEDFYGIGCGASGRLNGIRYDNTHDLNTYLTCGPCPVYDTSSLSSRAFEAIMMGLRTSFGVDILAFDQKYGISLESVYASVLIKYKAELEIVDHHLVCNEKGMEILNTILVDFLEVDW